MRRREENHNLNRYAAAMEVSEPMQQSMSKTSREERVPKAETFNPKAKLDRRSLFESKTSREVGVPKAGDETCVGGSEGRRRTT